MAEHLPVKQKRIFWKLVLVLPDGEEHTPESPGRSEVFHVGRMDTVLEQGFSIESCRPAGFLWGVCLVYA